MKKSWYTCLFLALGVFFPAMTMATGSTYSVGLFENISIGKNSSNFHEITIIKDGSLTYTTTAVSGDLMPGGYPSYARLYAANQTTAIDGGIYFNDSKTISNLSAGTYYVKVNTSNGSGVYTITTSFTNIMDSQSETEANDLTGTADAMVPPMTGSIGYTNYLPQGNGSEYRDRDDYYIISLAKEGTLDYGVVATEGDLMPGGYPSSLILYAADGTTAISSTYMTPGNSISEPNLAAGTYYLRVTVSSTALAYGSYSITSSFSPALAGVSDPEPNDDPSSAGTLQAGSITGTVGYTNKLPGDHQDTYRDLDDYFKIGLSRDGTLSYSVDTTTGNLMPGSYPSSLILYAADGTTAISSTYMTPGNSISEPNLAAGTYYLRVTVSPTALAYGSYTISATFAEALTGNGDKELNDISDDAMLLLGGTITGTIGYTNMLPGSDPDSHRDLVDWIRVVHARPGDFTYTLLSVQGYLMPGGYPSSVELFQADATTWISSIYMDQDATRTETNLAAGTYLLKVSMSPSAGGYGVYQIGVDRNKPMPLETLMLLLL